MGCGQGESDFNGCEIAETGRNWLCYMFKELVSSHVTKPRHRLETSPKREAANESGFIRLDFATNQPRETEISVHLQTLI